MEEISLIAELQPYHISECLSHLMSAKVSAMVAHDTFLFFFCFIKKIFKKIKVRIRENDQLAGF